VVDRAALTPRLVRDASVSAVVAGFVAVLVGYTSSAAIVFEAARALGADDATVASWMIALGLGMGATCIGLSLAYRAPIVTAWSTPGAALIATSAAGIALPEATGAFLLCGALLAVAGFSGAFERLTARLPASLAAAMLAGVLLRFGVGAFAALEAEFLLVATMFATWLAGRRLWPRYAIPGVLAVGLALAAFDGRIDAPASAAAVAWPTLTLPSFSIAAIVGLGLPLFVVTMASQNLPGAATLRAAGYATPPSPLVGWTGVTTVLLAPLGGFAFNLAAITAALCMGPEAHRDPSRRYVAAVAAGAFYLVLGAFGASVGALFAAVPHALVVAIAGLALLPTIGSALALAVKDDRQREAALVTFLVTASGIALAGVGAAFWGLCAGALTMLVLARKANV
jgi:benzoate membrane transport protein